MSFPVSIVITTKGRPDMALTAVKSCLAQEWDELEVLLFDDDPDQQTVRRMKKVVASPQLRVFTTDWTKGYIANRNRGFAEARGDIVFSLDDDAYFTDAETVSRCVAIFQADPSIAAVALPYIEPQARQSRSSRQTPFRSKAGDELRAYVGCAHALRRNAVLKLGGYREFFVHQVEERELSMRLWADGWRIVYGEGAPIVHNVDPRRDSRRVLYYACRNQVLNEFLNTPMPDLLLRVLRLSGGLLRYRFTWTSLPTKVQGLVAGLAQALVRRRLRRPMDRVVYLRCRSLPGHGPSEFSGKLPPPCMVRKERFSAASASAIHAVESGDPGC